MTVIQFLGRWGGDTVKGYVGEAMRGQAAEAIGAAGATGRVAEPGFELSRTLRQLVAEAWRAEAERREAATQWCAEQVLGEAKAAARAEARAEFESWLAEKWGAVARDEKAPVHEVTCGGPGEHPSVWVTRCGWAFGRSAHVRRPVSEVSCCGCKRGRSGQRQ